MVKITNGINVFEVTTGAYENNFKKLGYNIMDDNGNGKETKVVEDEVVEEVEKEVEDEVVEKPLSQWTKKEVKEYAEKHDIDLSGTKNVDEAKERISAHLDK